VNWLWLGALLMVVGGATAGLPRRVRPRPARTARAAAPQGVPATVGAP
jgi:cytochrome c biogenesis factor